MVTCDRIAFYVVCPIALIALMTRLRWRSLTWCLMVSAFAIAVLAYVGRPYLGAWTEIYVYLEPILLGCAVATARASGRAHVSGRQVSVALGLLIPTLLFYGTGTAYLLVLTFGACAATLMRGVLEHPNGLAARALSNRPLGVIGRTSYGTYLGTTRYLRSPAERAPDIAPHRRRRDGFVPLHRAAFASPHEPSAATHAEHDAPAPIAPDLRDP